ncbi:MAG: hypothetical protein IKZ61_02495 [Prevotella sp.]|nr:hypothetical protein [Prevotella sp.]
MKKLKNLARENQVLISQLPEDLRRDYHIYCDQYSIEFQAKFLPELLLLKDRPEVQYRFWDCFTNYTYHHFAGESAKQYTGDPILDSRLDYLYREYDSDPENLQKWRIKDEIRFICKMIEQMGYEINMLDCFLKEMEWRKECASHNQDYPTEKYVDMFDIDEEGKTKIKEMLRWKFPLDNDNEINNWAYE